MSCLPVKRCIIVGWCVCLLLTFPALPRWIWSYGDGVLMCLMLFMPARVEFISEFLLMYGTRMGLKGRVPVEDL